MSSFTINTILFGFKLELQAIRLRYFGKFDYFTYSKRCQFKELDRKLSDVALRSKQSPNLAFRVTDSLIKKRSQFHIQSINILCNIIEPHIRCQTFL